VSGPPSGVAQAALAPAPSTVTGGGIAQNRGVWLSWRAHGDGEPVLMIMGFMGSAKAWFRLLPHVSGAHRAIVFDNRGTGDSDRPVGLWSMADLVDDALAVLDAAGHETAHVVGVSMGGMIAQHLALDHPERVRSLSLICTRAGQGESTPWRMVASVALRPFVGPGRTFPIVAPLLYAERTRRERPEVLEDDLRVRFSDQAPGATALGQIAAMRGHDTRGRLGDLKMPVLVMHGEEDALIPPESGRELARLIPGAELVMLPDCGHLVATDAEAEAAEALVGFISRAA
jgi:3-oxoadipate enol-lactonase